MFGEAPAIERRGVEEVDAELERPLCRGDRSGVVEPCEEITKRRGSESEHRDLQPGPAKHPAPQASRLLPDRAGACFFDFTCQETVSRPSLNTMPSADSVHPI